MLPLPAVDVGVTFNSPRGAATRIILHTVFSFVSYEHRFCYLPLSSMHVFVHILNCGWVACCSHVLKSAYSDGLLHCGRSVFCHFAVFFVVCSEIFPIVRVHSLFMFSHFRMLKAMKLCSSFSLLVCFLLRYTFRSFRRFFLRKLNTYKTSWTFLILKVSSVVDCLLELIYFVWACWLFRHDCWFASLVALFIVAISLQLGQKKDLFQLRSTFEWVKN